MIVGAVLLAAAAGALAVEPELDGNCAMSASLGSKLPTSCSVVWISPQDKLYCFSNEMAKQAFLKDPAGNELRAQTFWKDPNLLEKLKKDRPEG
jgi:hypothetical protein